MGYQATEPHSAEILNDTLTFYDRKCKDLRHELFSHVRSEDYKAMSKCRKELEACESLKFHLQRLASMQYGARDGLICIALLYIAPDDVEIVNTLQVAKYISWVVKSGTLYEPISSDWHTHMNGALVNHGSVEVPDWGSHT